MHKEVIAHMNDLLSIRRTLEQRKGRASQLNKTRLAQRKQILVYLKTARAAEEAQLIIQVVAQLTQKQLEYHVAELVTLAMAAVFDNPYSLSVKFIQRRGRTETDLQFVRDGMSVDPLTASGGGAVDVAAFALRVALWSLAVSRTTATLVLDEPLKWLKGGSLPTKGALMIKEISEKLGIQIIMVSHIPDQIEGADQIINISINNGVSSTC